MSVDLNRITLGEQAKNMLAVGIKQERERWKAAVKQMIEQIDVSVACYELSEEEQIALPAEKEALNALLAKMEEADG